LLFQGILQYWSTSKGVTRGIVAVFGYRQKTLMKFSCIEIHLLYVSVSKGKLTTTQMRMRRVPKQKRGLQRSSQIVCSYSKRGFWKHFAN